MPGIRYFVGNELNVTFDLLLAKKTTWVIVADETTATIYSRKAKKSPLEELFTLENVTGRKKPGDLVSDRGGRSFDRFGDGRHTITKEEAGPKKRAAAAFAKKIALRINKAMREGTCDQFAVISAPRFLGVLRRALAKTGKNAPGLSIDKEMVGQDAATIEKLIADY